MEEKFSRVKSVQADGTWESKYGMLYSFEYTMEDGAVFKANHKTQIPLDPGTKATYTITKENQYGKLGKIHKADYTPSNAPEIAKSLGYSKNSDDGLKGVKIGHAVTNAVSLVCATGLVKDGDKTLSLKKSIKTYAELILQISDELANPGATNVSEKVQNVAQKLGAEVASPPLPVEEESDLPF